GPRHPEIVLEPRGSVVALLLTDQHDGRVAEPRRAADDRLVIAEAAIAAERHEILEQLALIVEEVRPERMTGNLGLLPWRQGCIEVRQALGRLALELADLLVDRHSRIVDRERPELGDFPFEFSNLAFEFEIGMHYGLATGLSNGRWPPWTSLS